MFCFSYRSGALKVGFISFICWVWVISKVTRQCFTASCHDSSNFKNFTMIQSVFLRNKYSTLTSTHWKLGHCKQNSNLRHVNQHFYKSVQKQTDLITAECRQQFDIDVARHCYFPSDTTICQSNSMNWSDTILTWEEHSCKFILLLWNKRSAM